jgi:hypothetical protein
MLTSCAAQDLRGFLPSCPREFVVVDADQIRRIVLDEIGDRWDEPNALDLRASLISPRLAS